MDMQMPELDGVGATRAIRALPGPGARVPIVALTADALPEFRARYMSSGLDDYLTKPIDWKALDRVLRRYVPEPAPATEPAPAAPEGSRTAGMPATARAPKSRERLNDFYDFCQGHAGEYNKGWNFYAGMSDGEVRAAKENEAMTGGRPTWEMKAGKFSREAAAFASKMGTANTKGAGSWQDSFGLFGRRTREQAGPAGEDTLRLGKLERAALSVLDLDARTSKAGVKARYHEMLKRFHPDLNQGDRGAEAKLQSVIKAYKTLKKAGLA
jgi:CheY-like chemotaxis protein